MPEQVTRGDLLHWYRPGYPHFVTYRLAGCLPESVMHELRLERERRLKAVPEDVDPSEYCARVHKLMFDRYDRWLDRHQDVRWLADPAVAKIVRENLQHHAGVKYELLAYCVMPNHVHVVLQPFESELSDAGSIRHVGDAASVRAIGQETPDRGSVLSRIMHSLKSYTANRANEVLQRAGSFWQRESYDHWVRDEDELARIIDYVAANPVRAGLCARPEDWPWSSANDRFRRDGVFSGLIGTLGNDWAR